MRIETMTSSVVEGGRDEGKHELSDLITETINLTAANLSLPNETFLRAAISLKDKACIDLEGVGIEH
ncbi:hypothetical protein CR513_38539, partial [Mucuna pruriens]